jgi:acetyl esterase/lipase
MAIQARIVLEPSAQGIVDATSTPPFLYELEPPAAKLRAAGVEVTTVRYDGVVHDFMLLNAMSEARGTRAAIAQATAFLRGALGTD